MCHLCEQVCKQLLWVSKWEAKQWRYKGMKPQTTPLPSLLIRLVSVETQLRVWLPLLRRVTCVRGVSKFWGNVAKAWGKGDRDSFEWRMGQNIHPHAEIQCNEKKNQRWADVPAEPTRVTKKTAYAWLAVGHRKKKTPAHLTTIPLTVFFRSDIPFGRRLRFVCSSLLVRLLRLLVRAMFLRCRVRVLDRQVFYVGKVGWG